MTPVFTFLLPLTRTPRDIRNGDQVPAMPIIATLSYLEYIVS